MTRAQTVYGLGTLTMDFLGNLAGAQGLVPLDPVTGMAGTAIPVTGVAARQSLVGMDFRANNGQLYALGYDSAALAPAPNAQFYTLNPTSGAAATPGIGAVAYTNAFPSATSTTLYAFDELNTSALGNTANTALLSIVSPPNAGTLTAPVPVMFGSFGTGAPAAIDIDIYANGAANRNEAFLMEVTAMGSRNFSRLNLATGQATLLGNAVPRNIPFALRDIAVAIGRPLATAPLAQLVSVCPNPDPGHGYVAGARGAARRPGHHRFSLQPAGPGNAPPHAGPRGRPRPGIAPAHAGPRRVLSAGLHRRRARCQIARN